MAILLFCLFVSVGSLLVFSLSLFALSRNRVVQSGQMDLSYLARSLATISFFAFPLTCTFLSHETSTQYHNQARLAIIVINALAQPFWFLIVVGCIICLFTLRRPTQSGKYRVFLEPVICWICYFGLLIGSVCLSVLCALPLVTSES